MNSSVEPADVNNPQHRKIHVAPHGSDQFEGNASAPLQTITAAAALAMPGDTIVIHAGIYREHIDPPRGGISANQPITYQAAENEQVEIRGSELLSNWTQVDEHIWTTSVSNQLFGNFNPYTDRIRGDWFREDGRAHHTGALYINNEWLTEMESTDSLKESETTAGTWHAQVNDETTIFWAHFNGRDPNAATTEANVRQAVFYPTTTGINYITLRGLNLRHAATNWAPPTAEQIGLVGTNWSKGWVIENNTVTHSRCCGITLGKHGDEFDNTSADTAVGYDQTIERAFAQGWHKDTIGSHIVRNNTIAFCEQAGIVGSLGAIFSEITDNTIRDIHVQGLFSGEEQAGIKIHAPIDTLIAGNHIYRTFRAIWVDWMTQGTRISRNLCYENEQEDLYIEVNHGPYIVDQNIFLSKRSIKNWSQGGAFIRNLFGGELLGEAVLKRTTPYHYPHTTQLAGACHIQGGDDRFYNNLIVDHDGLLKHQATVRRCEATQGKDGQMESHTHPSSFAGNIKMNEVPTLITNGEALLLQFSANLKIEPLDGAPVIPDTNTLGTTHVTALPYLNYDARPLDFTTTTLGPFGQIPRPSDRLSVPQSK